MPAIRFRLAMMASLPRLGALRRPLVSRLFSLSMSRSTPTDLAPLSRALSSSHSHHHYPTPPASSPAFSAAAAAAAASAAAAAGLSLLPPLSLCEVSVPPVSDYEASYTTPTTLGPDEHLVAGGVRTMTPLKVPVYILQLYVDPTRVRAKLALWRGQSAAFILADRDFWDRLSSPLTDFRRTVRLSVLRTVTGNHMQHGFERGLGWRVKAAARKMGLPGGRDGLKVFNKAFVNAGVLEEGSEIIIRFRGMGRMTLLVGKGEAVEIDSKPLVWALLQMFYGEKSVAPTVKENVAHGFEEMLKDE